MIKLLYSHSGLVLFENITESEYRSISNWYGPQQNAFATTPAVSTCRIYAEVRSSSIHHWLGQFRFVFFNKQAYISWGDYEVYRKDHPQPELKQQKLSSGAFKAFLKVIQEDLAEMGIKHKTMKLSAVELKRRIKRIQEIDTPGSVTHSNQKENRQ